jgi:hypothetical protein
MTLFWIFIGTVAAIYALVTLHDIYLYYKE